MAKWVVAAKKADFDSISKKYGISPVLARIIRNRDVITDDEFDFYLNGRINDLHDAMSMMDIVKACSLLVGYIGDKKRIRIIGDYDVDGICSTYILLKGLEACGADVDYAIPHRIIDGYGLNINLIDNAHKDGREVIITCDNGISAAEQIAYANELGMHVIVTDHHEVPYEVIEDEYDSDETDDKRIEILPPADAVVDPHRDGDNYPFAGICGAVVAWKLISVLLPMMNVPKEKADALILELLEEAAIATVGDVMELRNENRIIVREGLKRVSNTANVGLNALIRAVELSDKNITAYHIGFVIGPCLNATGRLDTAARALELLECQDPNEAAIIANELKELNDARKDMTERGVITAIDDIEGSKIGDDKVLILYLPKVHESLAGIIAGRIREKYEKPTIVMTDAETDGSESVIKGSGRSIEAYNMYEELVKCKDLFTKFGGHKMAAGLSMPLDNLEEFRKRINDECKLSDDDLVTKTVIDVPLPVSYINFDFVNELSLLEPFGNGNSKPIFAQKDVQVHRARIVGKNNSLLILSATADNGYNLELKMFYKTDSFMEEVDAYYGNGTSGDLVDGRGHITMDIIYYPGINEFRGNRSLDFIVNDYRLK